MEGGSADFRLMDKKVVTVLQGINEHEIFFRGMIKWVGFKQISISYVADERLYGETKYNTKQMVKLALMGLTSFSTKPLFFAAYLGFAFSAASLLYIPYVLLSYMFGHTVSGWISIIITIAFFGGLELSILGIMGLYLGKVFMQSKQRPLYIILEKKLGNAD
jgi:dolichol-phosphate mannosyltransferase